MSNILEFYKENLEYNKKLMRLVADGFKKQLRVSSRNLMKELPKEELNFILIRLKESIIVINKIRKDIDYFTGMYKSTLKEMNTEAETNE